MQELYTNYKSIAETLKNGEIYYIQGSEELMLLRCHIPKLIYKSNAIST